MSGAAPTDLRRRAVVLSGPLLLAGALTACTNPGGRPTPTPTPPGPDALLAQARARAVAGVLDAHRATVGAHPGLGPRLTPFAARHEAHLRALGVQPSTPSASVSPGGAPPGSAPPATGSQPAGPAGASAGTPSGTPAMAAVPADPQAALAALARAETALATGHRDACLDAQSPLLARLFASLAACAAAHGELLR